MQLVSFRGTVAKLGPVEMFGKEKNFPVQRVVVERAAGRWQVEFVGEAGIDMAESLAVGDVLDLNCDLSCREWQKDSHSQVKYFYGLKVVSVQKGETAVVDGKNQTMFGGNGPAGADITKMDDVPF